MEGGSPRARFTAEAALLVPALLLGACGRLGFGAVERDASAPGDIASSTDAAPGVCAFDLCEGFESAALDPRWSTSNAVAIDNAFTHSGSQAIHMHGVALNAGDHDYATISESVTFATAPPQIWVRAWFRISQLPAGGNGMELIAATNSGPSDVGDYVFLTASTTSLYAEIPNTTVDTTMAPIDTWFCLVDHLVLATTATGTLELSGDTVAPIAIPDIKTQPSPPLAQLAFGIGFADTNVANNQPVTELWVDDIVVHHAPITCAD